MKKRYVVKSTKETNHLDAAEVAEEILAAYKAKQNSNHAMQQDRSFAHFAYLLMKIKKSRAKGERNKRSYTNEYKLLYREKDGVMTYFGDYDAGKITSGAVRAYPVFLDSRRDEPLAASTEALLQATATALEINDLTRHLSGSLIYNMERACVLRKTSQAFYAMDMPQKGLAFAKGAMDALQGARRATLGLPQDMQSCFRDAIADQYRALAGLMTEAGQLDEAQATLTQLADFETYKFWQDDTKLSGDAFADVVKRPAEQAMVSRVAGLGLADMGALRAQLDQAKADGKETDAAALQLRLEEAQEALALSLDDLGDVLAERVDEEEGATAELADELASEVSARALRRLQGRLERLSGTASVYSLTLPDRTHFLIVTDQGTEHIALDMPEPELATAVAQLRNGLQGLSADDPLEQQQLFYATVWAAVEDVLRMSKAENVLLTLDAPLRRVPLGALHDGKKWLLEDRNYVTFMPAGKDLLLDETPVEMDAIQALGASDGGAGFSSLPNVASELRSIVRDEATGAGILPGRIRLNADFNETGFADALDSGAPVLHIASHFNLRDRDDRSVLLLGTGDTLSMADLKSGIRKGRYDLSNIDLLVLSACQTALDGSAGLESFASAMHAEGVRTVLATLWPVPDRSTALFMQRYYHHLSTGERRADALRLTQIEFLRLDETQIEDLLSRGAASLDQEESAPMINSPSHPRAWAGFQLIGQWR
ncbi:CHAT domain-containing protein [Thioclava sp. FR2]|uniref:CHAT domain-containing protein n=1 Tax=Thioclava sp. FR2 TaxID=3445780 RepID=UPI003EBB203E